MSTKKIIEKDWSCGMETEDYEKDMELLITDAFKAVEETGEGYFVNLVTPAIHGSPEQYLVPVLINRFGSTITTKFVDQCGCGGYVLKVTKK